MRARAAAAAGEARGGTHPQSHGREQSLCESPGRTAGEGLELLVAAVVITEAQVENSPVVVGGPE